MWKIIGVSLLMACIGTVILRLSGRKSISQMSVPQLAVIISLGTILGGEMSGKGLGKTILAVLSFVGFLVVTEWITMKSNRAEKVLKGMAIPVISDGRILVDQLKGLRMTVDDLEKRLRIAGIERVEDIQTGTIESNGDFGYLLMPHARPVTMGDLERILRESFPQASMPMSEKEDQIFNEVITREHSKDIPKPLH